MLGVGQRGPLGRAGRDDDQVPAGAPDAQPAAGADDAERDAWIVLAGTEGVGPVSFARLVGAFGSASAVLEVARRGDAVPALVAATRGPDGQGPALAPTAAHAIEDAAAAPWRLLEPVRRSGVSVLTLVDERYPGRLRAIELPPPVLYLRGSVDALDRPRSVSIVGTRRPTTQGRVTASRIAEAVAGFGATVVSGLALGIDAAAHAAAVRVGTPTVAVIGGGHEHLYPAGHRGLAHGIVAGGGAVLSEFPPDTQPTRGTFPRRNRIISGLADATIVVEAGARSGALTTAAWALEQGRSLHLVPGRLDDPTVAGCLAFLREAGPDAHVVAGIPELIEDLGFLDRTAGSARDDRVPRDLAPVEREIARHVATGRCSVDELVRATGEAPATVLGALTSLEIRGLVIETFGRYGAAGSLALEGRRAVRIPGVSTPSRGRRAA